jgi:hypothetical protein
MMQNEQHWMWRPGVRESLGLKDDPYGGEDDLSSMKRGELNDYARSVGIEDPESYSNKTALLEALAAL